MGWFWSSDSSSASTEQVPAVAPSQPAPAPTPPRPSPKGDNLADDPEIRKFLAFFQESDPEQPVAPSQAASASTPEEPPKPSLVSSWRSWSRSSTTVASSTPDSLATTTTVESVARSSSSPEEDGTRERSLAEAVLPVSMSCRQAFDLAWGCQSPGGQFRAVYRHGGVKPCSELWDDFWFCMRVKSYAPGPAKEEAIRAHYREKEHRKYYAEGQPSSEDVWRARTVDEVLPPDAVFQHSFQTMLSGEGQTSAEAAQQEDVRQIREDMERRRRIREQMGYNNDRAEG